MTKNKNYARGRRYEYKAMEILKKVYGCKIVIRSAKSGGLADVVGVSDDATFLVQVKSEKEIPQKAYGLFLERRQEAWYYVAGMYLEFAKLTRSRVNARVGLFVFDRKRKLVIIVLDRNEIDIRKFNGSPVPIEKLKKVVKNES